MITELPDLAQRSQMKGNAIYLRAPLYDVVASNVVPSIAATYFHGQQEHARADSYVHVICRTERCTRHRRRESEACSGNINSQVRHSAEHEEESKRQG